MTLLAFAILAWAIAFFLILGGIALEERDYRQMRSDPWAEPKFAKWSIACLTTGAVCFIFAVTSTAYMIIMPLAKATMPIILNFLKSL